MRNSLSFFLLGLATTLVIFATFRNGPISKPGLVISADHCNELYVGVDNPVNMVLQGYKPLLLSNVSIDNGTITGDSGMFIVKPAYAGEVSIKVKAQNIEQSRHFKVKPIIPIPRLGAQYGDGAIIGNGEFKAQKGLAALINCCGFDAKCDMVSFSIIRIGKDGTSMKANNQGPRFDKESSDLIQKALPGDQYIFFNILARCPGDVGTQSLGAISINIMR